jgi:hypothetical protein
VYVQVVELGGVGATTVKAVVPRVSVKVVVLDATLAEI